MIFKLAQCAEKKWNKLHKAKLLADMPQIVFYFLPALIVIRKGGLGHQICLRLLAASALPNAEDR